MGNQTEMTIQALAGALVRATKGRKVLVVASTDLSHFLGRAQANERDRKTIELIQKLDLKTLGRQVERHENLMCGGGPVLALLHYARKMGPARVATLSYSDSAAAGGPDDRVVGYLSAAVYLESAQMGLDLTPEEKRNYWRWPAWPLKPTWPPEKSRPISRPHPAWKPGPGPLSP